MNGFDTDPAYTSQKIKLFMKISFQTKNTDGFDFFWSTATKTLNAEAELLNFSAYSSAPTEKVSAFFSSGFNTSA